MEDLDDTSESVAPFEVEIGDSIDLHAFHPSEVKAVTEAYLAAAHSKGFRLVRIVHGKGIGVQREIVRKVLGESPMVESFKDAPEFSGGWGATVAVLRD